MRKETRQADAKDIEISHDMVQAGLRELSYFDPTLGNGPDVVANIFSSMLCFLGREGVLEPVVQRKMQSGKVEISHDPEGPSSARLSYGENGNKIEGKGSDFFVEAGQDDRIGTAKHAKHHVPEGRNSGLSVAFLWQDTRRVVPG
jgi:hypothetical protein